MQVTSQFAQCITSFFSSTADSHPVHVHQVKFQVVRKCASNDTDCMDIDGGVLGYETGWKDAVIAYPYVDSLGDPVTENTTGVVLPVGFTTTIRMKVGIRD